MDRDEQTAPGPVADQVVPGNRWDLLDVPALGDWDPTLRVSVVLPHFEAPEKLEITLAALARQTYPAELVQIVVADDGSTPPLELDADHRGMDVTVVHQDDRGFGLARARNTGAAAADGDVLVFLDCDMVPEPDHLEAHARWHHVCGHAVTLGFRRHVEFGDIGVDEVDAAATRGSLAPLFEGRTFSEPAWLERHLERTEELTTDDDDLFRATTGGNLGVPAELFAIVGGFDESFTQWGSEDTDLGHRLFLAGAVLVPERRAACWHQGDSRGLEPHERRSLDEQRAKISQTVSHAGFRRAARGRSFDVPRFLAHVRVADEPHATVTATLESLVASDLHDLEVLLDIPEDHPDRVRLRREWAGDPRVLADKRAAHLRVPYRVAVPVGAAFAPGAFDEVLATMVDVDAPTGVLRLVLDGGDAEAVVVATRALGRARLLLADDEQARAGELFGARTMPGRELGIRWEPVTELVRVPRPPRSRSRQRAREGGSTDATRPPVGTSASSGDDTAGGSPSGGAGPGGGVPSRPPLGSGGRSRVGPWLLIDTPLGWLTRGIVGEVVTDADEQVTRARHEAARAHHEAEVARYERDRLHARKAVRVAKEVADTAGGRSLRSLPDRLRTATTPVAAPPPPPDGPAEIEPETAARRRVASIGDRGLLPPRPARPAPLPHLRVLHLGAAGRFLPLAPHTAVDPDRWRAQLEDGADLLLIEPPGDDPAWDPLGGGLADLLRAATDHGVPSVRLAVPSSHGGPGTPTLELVEGAVPGPDLLVEGPGSATGPVGGSDAAGVLFPSIDTSVLNPMGWRSQPPDPVVAVLGRRPDDVGRELLAGFDPPAVLVHPADLPSVGDELGIRKTVSTPRALKQALVRAGVLLDHPSWRGDATETLRMWTAALACGTPVVVVDEVAADSGELELPDGTRLAVPPGMIVTRSGEAIELVHRLLLDLDQRERYGIVGRRWALRTGGREAAFRALLAHLDVPVPEPLRTTVLLATNRPDFLERGLANVARQTQPGVDVSLVLHGSAFDGVDVPDRGGLVSSVVRAPGGWRLGDCLNAALDHARGELVAKMDDDDHYGPEHLRDLATAWGYSGADIVGKRVEYVHLARRGITLRRPTSPPERDRPHVGGPTLFGSRETLRRHRFLRVPNRVDSTLYERVIADGGRVYGIHSRDLVLERHGQDHAWDAGDDEFLVDAIDQREGLAIDLASSDPDTGT